MILDTRNHPLLVHDDTGKAAVTLVCALVRCFQQWALTAVYAEGDMFAGAGGSEGGGVGNAGREVSAFSDWLWWSCEVSCDKGLELEGRDLVGIDLSCQ